MAFLLDFKYALRLLLKSPKFTALTLFVLVGGLSISLFTFSFLYSTLYKDVPLPEGDLMRTVGFTHEESTNSREVPSYEFISIRDQLKTVKDVGVYYDSIARLTKGEQGKNLSVSYVEANMFSFSQTNAFKGRTLQDADLADGAPKVAVISWDVWQHELQADENIIGKNIKIDNQNTTVVGVMPEGYNFPVNSKIWLPLASEDVNPLPKSTRLFLGYAKLKPEFSEAEAAFELTQAMNNLYRTTQKTFNKDERVFNAVLLTFPQAQTDGNGNTVFIFLNGVAFAILLLACINVGNLLLARAIERQKETAIRAALGAPSYRLISQLMWEGSIITILGSVLALLLVGAALEYTDMVIKSYIPDGLAFWWNWGLDLPTILMATAFCSMTIFLACFIPAWRASKQDVNTVLRDGTRGAQGKKAGRLSRILVTLQVFLIALLLLIGSVSAFLSHFFLNMDIGISQDKLIKADVWYEANHFKDKGQKTTLFTGMVNQLNNMPNIKGAVAKAFKGSMPVTIEHIENVKGSELEIEVYSLIGNTEFYGPYLVSGRHLSNQDDHNNRQTALISQSMANRYWPSESPLEKRVAITIDDKQEWFHVVGVVSDIMNVGAFFSNRAKQDEIYISGLLYPGANLRIDYSYIGTEPKAEQGFYQALYQISPHFDDVDVRNAERSMNVLQKVMRLTSSVTFSASGFALMLALAGIYGMTANTVMQRTHEIGIRRAVGATDQSIIKLFLKQGSKQLFIGLGCAIAIFAVFLVLFNGFSDGIIPAQLYMLLTFTVTFGLSLIVALAIYLPTRQAVQLEPAVAMRHE